ncbi:H(+)-transporting V0 sector ATPase subunit a [Lobosporangium transversale]|uniref:V-type proton ATPase subunit a n=1 Tax=Lobosporangium transversale TaxID=64571 RepID=A0A1Y2GX88_9FUNG|nr:V-type ATPase, V0 complex, 116kDa subunit family [Lobosporangium transversale]KAF9917355.1 H(+)-transporting V0 sector ATPase subunit a [Lobosporangium transversale]ORZ24857.1 V-type ATPase, V0 complex, 116kDa subunit family [Lobosporangium transversale]|eukprot:XP_021883838.1 V-type ATPase, V0 complex, 116kDa subunit family [Lobosporangium transversale]
MTESTFFRSEEMSLIQLYIPAEVAQPAVSELGELGLVQFRDLNPDVNAFQRAFVTEIRRFDEMERQLRFFTSQIEKAEIPIRHSHSTPYLTRARSRQELDDLEERLSEHENRLLQMNNSYETMQRRFLELTEQKHVLRETHDIFEDAAIHQEDARRSFDEPSAPLLDDLETGAGLQLGNVTGVIPRSKMQTFERILWRSLRGNLYMNTAEIEEPVIDPSTDVIVEKNVFIIFAHGREILAKIRKIAESLGATLYPVDASPDRRREALSDVMRHIEEFNSVLANTTQTRRQELMRISENLNAWMTIVKKEKATYHTMNHFNYDINRKCLIAEGWCPTNEISTIQTALRGVTERAGSTAPTILNELRTHREPPTYHKTNKFTAGFQAIVDAYGMARYREVNPGLFTVISFPFLFAVMFGDVGHGILVLLGALYLVMNERKLAHVDGEMFQMVYGGRYIILLMGAFSIFTGMMYNDIFSRALPWFQTGWVFNVPEDYDGKTVIVAEPNGHTYPFGIDYAWHGTENYLLFTNSYKMKMSVVLGVIHMSFGICMVYYNAKFFRKPIDIIGGFIPQLLFMQVLFGYLVIMIVYKWTVDWFEHDAAGYPVRNTPPSLLNTMIYMFLSPGSVNENDKLYPGQGFIQGLLVFIAFICIPWMLFLKPYYLKHEHNNARSKGYHQPSENHVRISTDSTHSDDIGGAVVADDVEHEEEFEFSEELIHQVIHTIDFCLGCISNTASYLRLWALSLAHAQLSEVLWTMTLGMAWSFTGFVGTFLTIVMFSVWFSLTIFILVGMEGLSAFLHALRLHWVEFNNKFYQGTGYAFEPFSFVAVLSQKDA